MVAEGKGDPCAATGTFLPFESISLSTNPDQLKVPTFQASELGLAALAISK